MPQFKFCFHLESKMSAAAAAAFPPCHDQDHLHIAWGWDNPSPLLSFVPLLQLFTLRWASFTPDESPFLHRFFPSSIMPFYDSFQLEMVCIVWEVCVFAHLPSYWMLSGSRLAVLPYIAVIEYSRFVITSNSINNMSPDCTSPDHCPHVGQTDSNPTDAAKLLTSPQNFKKVCPALCRRSHQGSGRRDQL